MLVEAFKRVRQRHPDATLTIVGCSPNLNVSGCTVVGKVPLSDIPAYMASASIFCVPALCEPFGMVFVEALRSGLPIVTADEPATPELVRESQTGALVRPGDVNGLATALSDLLDHPGFCLSLAKRGVALARHRYNWHAVGQSMGAHIEGVLNEKGAELCSTPS